MIIYPAIDLRNGKVVRLQEGDRKQETVFSESPIDVAQQWIAEGAEWLHIVNLDGAFGDENSNLAHVSDIAQADVHIQFGGGLRSLDDIKRVLDLGVERVVLGTLAMNHPEIISEALNTFGEDAICVAMDARHGFVTTQGWTKAHSLTPIEFGHLMKERGVKHALYTDVSRDGSMFGVNVKETIAIARNTGLAVIASGGVGHMIEIAQLAKTGVISGVVIGMALYRNEISLQEAILVAKAHL